MRLFDPLTEPLTESRRHQYAALSGAITLANFLAAAMFVIGSILFFEPETTEAGTWMFLIGSILFAIAPTLALVREINARR